MNTLATTDPVDLSAALDSLTSKLADLESRLFQPISPVLDGLLTPKDLADRLGVTERTLAEWRVGPPSTGPAFCRVGKTVRYRAQVVDLWLLEQEVSSTHEEG